MLDHIGAHEKAPTRRILIADDAPSSRELLRSILADSGHEVVEATDGVEVLESVVCSLPSLIIIDMELSGIDGYDTLRRVRALPGSERTPVVALITEPAHVAREEIMAAGFSAYLVKPIAPSQLRACARRLLAGSQG